MNNARIKCENRLVAVTNLEMYDEEQQIWKAEILKLTEQKETLGTHLFISRLYDPENNEMDTVLKEYHFKSDSDVLDEEFWLIPAEKILFIFEPHSTILKPNFPLTRGQGRGKRRPPLN